MDKVANLVSSRVVTKETPINLTKSNETTIMLPRSNPYKTEVPPDNVAPRLPAPMDIYEPGNPDSSPTAMKVEIRHQERPRWRLRERMRRISWN